MKRYGLIRFKDGRFAIGEYPDGGFFIISDVLALIKGMRDKWSKDNKLERKENLIIYKSGKIKAADEILAKLNEGEK